MLLSRFLYVLFCALSFCFAFAHPKVEYTVRNSPGASDVDTIRSIRRSLSEAAVRGRDVELKGNTTLDRSWDKSVLYKYETEFSAESQNNKSSLEAKAGVEIVCTQCYVKGIAFAELNIKGDFDAGLIIGQLTDEVHDGIQNFTETVDDYFIDYAKGVNNKIEEDGFDWADLEFPTMDYDFGFDIPAIPECNLQIRFDAMEVFMKINTILSAEATYELSLYSSKTAVGIKISDDLTLGIVFNVDLILSVNGQIDISTGFHLKLDDGIALNIALFSEDIADIVFNGGKFEFLPVTIESGGIVFSAILRVGIHAGLSVVTPFIPPITIGGKTIPSVGGGIEVALFANVAEFVTNVTFEKERECQLQVVQSYQLAIGAAAGATVAIGTETWGPAAETLLPIFNTVLAEICAIQKTAEPTPTITPKPNRRQVLSTVTTSSEATYTVVQCKDPAKPVCPASEQVTTQTTETITITTAIPSGEEFKFPVTVQDAVVTTVAFGSNTVEIPKTKGSPVSFVPPSPKETGKIETQNHDDNNKDGKSDIDEFADKTKKKLLDGKVGGVDKKIIFGLSFGLGLLLILALIGALVLINKHKRKAAEKVEESKPEAVPMIAEPYGHTGFSGSYTDKPVKPSVEITEVNSTH